MDPGEGYLDRDVKLSGTIMEYWVNLARGGDPNGAGLPAWPAYGPEADLNIELSDEIAVHSGLRREACDLAERIHLAGIAP